MWNEAASELHKMVISMQNQLSKAKELLDLFGESPRNDRVVIYAATQNMYEDMEAAAKSLLEHTDVDKVYFFVEDDDYVSPIPELIEPINVSGQHYFYDKGPNFQTRCTWMTMMRCALHDMFPQYERMLWLDTDTIVKDDISELFELPMNGNYYGAVHELRIAMHQTMLNHVRDNDGYAARGPSRIANVTYYNVGILLCNLKALRDGKGDEIMRMLNTEFFQHAEQDVINIACQGRIFDLPGTFNSAPFTDEVQDPKILHISYSIDESKKRLKQMYKEMDWSWVITKMEERGWKRSQSTQ